MSVPLHFLMHFKKVRRLSRALDDHVKATNRLEAEIDELSRHSRSLELKLKYGNQIYLEYQYGPKERKWRDTRSIQRLTNILGASVTEYQRWIDNLLTYRSNFEAISLELPSDPQKPYWLNDWIPPLDTMSLYAMLAKRIPRKYVEVGSGNSTKFARQAITDHGLPTRVISIDPSPRAEIDQICDEVVRTPCEDVPISFFEDLDEDDILFIDNSHRSFMNSDVTMFFMEILPGLKRGTLVGIHDIFLPSDYPEAWVDRYYNEQYLLAAYIQGGMDGGKIIMPNRFIMQTPSLVARLDDFSRSPKLARLEIVGGTFWFTR